MKALVLGLIGSLLTGCASLSESECRSQDAFSIGHRDGQRGEQRSRLLKHQEACARYQIQLHAPSYQQGYQQGLELYCTPQNGYQQGSQGAVYQGVCPAELEPAFLREYRPAYEHYQLRQRIEQLQDEIEQIRLRQYEIESMKLDDALRREHRQLFRNRLQLERELQQSQFDWQRLQPLLPPR